VSRLGKIQNDAAPRLPRDRRLRRVQCLAHGNLSEHERAPAIYDRHQHLGGDLPLCRHAITLASQLPDNTEDALIVLQMAIQLVEQFLVEGEEPCEGSVIQLVRDD